MIDMESCESIQILEGKGSERRKLKVEHNSLKHYMHLMHWCGGAWERGAETAMGVKMQTAVLTDGSGISRKGKQWGENLLLTLLLQMLSFKAVLQNSMACDRQENDVQSMVSQEKAVSVTDCCAHPQEVNEELHGFCFKWSWTVIPGDLRADIMQWIHISHLGIETCLRWARKCIYRPGMNTQLKAHMEQCKLCKEYSDWQETPHGIPDQT